MMSPDIVAGAAEHAVGDEVDNATAVFVVDDNACALLRVRRPLPTDTLYYARLPEGPRADSARWARSVAGKPDERPQRPDGSRAHAAKAVARRKNVKLKPPSPRSG